MQNNIEETPSPEQRKESHYRSVLKGISWRIVGTLDTMLISYILTKDISKALKIGVTEVLTKIVLYWMHERIWLLFTKGKTQSHIVSVIKSATWRVVGSLDTMLWGWYYTGEFKTGLSIASVEVITKMILYYFHERLWLRVPVGAVRKWFPWNRG